MSDENENEKSANEKIRESQTQEDVRFTVFMGMLQYEANSPRWGNNIKTTI